MNIINIPQPPININEHEYNRLLGLKYNKRDAFLEYLKKRYKRIRYNIILNKIELINWENKEEIFEDRLINEWYLDLSYNEEYLVPIRKDGSQYHYPTTVLDYAAELRSFQSYYKTTNVKMSLQELHCIINNEVTTPSYNPVEEIFELLKVMVTDVKEPTELNKFIKCFKCNKQSDELVRMYFYSWVSGVFRNCLELDKKAYDAILIFKSKQGDGKSKAIEEHFLKMFNKYFTSTFNWSTSDKDELLKLSSNIFIYDDELTATTKGKIEDIKKITSMRSLIVMIGLVVQDWMERLKFWGNSKDTE